MGQRTYWMEQPAVDAMCREGGEERKEGLNVHAMFKYRYKVSLSMLSSSPPSIPGTQLMQVRKQFMSCTPPSTYPTQLAIQLLHYRGDNLYTNAFPPSFPQITIVL